MATKTEATIIADIYKDTYGLGKFFIAKIDPDTAENKHELDGKQLNSAYWLVAHTIWAQHALQVLALDGPPLDIPWLNHYMIGSDGTLHEGRPPFTELLNVMDTVNTHAQAFIRTLTDEQLDEPNNRNIIPWDATKRRMLYHSIRHHGQHIGHISWICKLNGVETV